MAGSTVMKFSTYEIPPWVNVNHYNSEFQFGTSVMKDLSEFLTRTLNITFKSVKPPEDIHGNLNPGSNWTGVIGVLSRKEADIGLLPFGLSLRRFEAIRFTAPFYYSYATILAQSPQSFKDPFSFLKAFEIEVWICLFVSIITMSTVLRLSEKTTPIKKKISPDSNVNVIKFNFCFWILISNFLQQGVSWKAKNPLSKALSAVWLYVSEVTALGFSGILIALYALSKNVVVETMEDVAQLPSIRPTTPKGSVFQEYFEFSSSDVNLEVWKRMKKKDGCLSVSHLLGDKNMRDIRLGKSVIIYEIIPIKFVISKMCTGTGITYHISQPLFWIPLSLAVRKDLPTMELERLNRAILRYTESNQIQIRLDEIFHLGRKCNWSQQAPSVSPLGFREISGLIYLLLIGYLTSIVAFTFERSFKMRKCLKKI